jgi:hypothetical protein
MWRGSARKVVAGCITNSGRGAAARARDLVTIYGLVEKAVLVPVGASGEGLPEERLLKRKWPRAGPRKVGSTRAKEIVRQTRRYPNHNEGTLDTPYKLRCSVLRRLALVHMPRGRSTGNFQA